MWCCAPWATRWARSRAALVNYVVRNVKKLVPAFDLPKAVRYKEAMRQGRSATFKAQPSAPTTSPCCSTPAAPPA